MRHRARIGASSLAMTSWLRSLRINEDACGKENIQVALTLEKRASLLSEVGRQREAS